MTEPSLPPSPPPTDSTTAIAQAALALKGAAEEFQKKTKRDAVWTKVKRTVIVAFFATCLLGYWASLYKFTATGKMGNQPVPSVAVINLHGEMETGALNDADHVNPLIEKACNDPNVKTILLDINSPGGSPTEAERIVSEIHLCKAAHRDKAIDSMVESMAASAAYMVAMHTDRIYANRYAVVGSIGALITYFDASDLAHRLGVSQEIFRSMPLKGGPSMWTKTSPEDAAINDEMVKAMGTAFLNDVIKSRGAKLKIDRTTLFSGRIWTSDQALAMGLIDQQGVIEDLKQGPMKGLKFVTYDNRSPAQKLFNSEVLIHSVMSALTTPQIR